MAAADITGAIVTSAQVEMLSVAGAVSALDFETLSIGFASALGIEVDVGRYLFAVGIETIRHVQSTGNLIFRQIYQYVNMLFI